jgi:hypothetical protein
MLGYILYRDFDANLVAGKAKELGNINSQYISRARWVGCWLLYVRRRFEKAGDSELSGKWGMGEEIRY